MSKKMSDIPFHSTTNTQKKDQAELDQLGSALINAANRSYNSQVSKLTQLLANPNIADFIDFQDEDGSTALMCASNDEKCDLVKMLLAAKANPNLQNLNGHTAMMLANKNKHNIIKEASDIVRMLLAAKANPNLQDNEGKTALHYYYAGIGSHNPEISCSPCHPSPYNDLISAGFNVNLQDKEGNTILHFAALYNAADSIEHIISLVPNDKKFAYINAKNMYGETAIQLTTSPTVKQLLFGYRSYYKYERDQTPAPLVFSSISSAATAIASSTATAAAAAVAAPIATATAVLSSPSSNSAASPNHKPTMQESGTKFNL